MYSVEYLCEGGAYVQTSRRRRPISSDFINEIIDGALDDEVIARILIVPREKSAEISLKGAAKI